MANSESARPSDGCNPHVDATLRDFAGLEPVTARVRPDTELEAVVITVTGGELTQELVIGREQALDLAMRLVASAARLRPGAEP